MLKLSKLQAEMKNEYGNQKIVQSKEVINQINLGVELNLLFSKSILPPVELSFGADGLRWLLFSIQQQPCITCTRKQGVKLTNELLSTSSIIYLESVLGVAWVSGSSVLQALFSGSSLLL